MREILSDIYNGAICETAPLHRQMSEYISRFCAAFEVLLSTGEDHKRLKENAEKRKDTLWLTFDEAIQKHKPWRKESVLEILHAYLLFDDEQKKKAAAKKDGKWADAENTADVNWRYPIELFMEVLTGSAEDFKYAINSYKNRANSNENSARIEIAYRTNDLPLLTRWVTGEFIGTLFVRAVCPVDNGKLFTAMLCSEGEDAQGWALDYVHSFWTIQKAKFLIDAGDDAQSEIECIGDVLWMDLNSDDSTELREKWLGSRAAGVIDGAICSSNTPLDVRARGVLKAAIAAKDAKKLPFAPYHGGKDEDVNRAVILLLEAMVGKTVDIKPVLDIIADRHMTFDAIFNTMTASSLGDIINAGLEKSRFSGKA